MHWNRASYFEFDRKSMETETKTWSEFPNGQKAIIEQILASEEINKSKWVDCDSHIQGKLKTDKAHSSSLLHAIIAQSPNLFLKYFQILHIFAHIFKTFPLLCPFLKAHMHALLSRIGLTEN